MNIKKIYNENTAFTVRHCAFCQTGAYNVFSVHFFLSVVIPKKINIESSTFFIRTLTLMCRFVSIQQCCEARIFCLDPETDFPNFDFFKSINTHFFSNVIFFFRWSRSRSLPDFDLLKPF